jgi:hypothetical protein
MAVVPARGRRGSAGRASVDVKQGACRGRADALYVAMLPRKNGRAIGPLLEAAMDRRFFVGWLLVFVLWMLGSFIVHGHLLADDYAAIAKLFRPPAEAQRHFPWMIAAHAILSGAFVWIYSRGIDAGPWLPQGIRFGVAVALLTAVPTYMIDYVVQPMPGSIAFKQALLDGVLVVLLGVATAFLYRQPAAARDEVPLAS